MNLFRAACVILVLGVLGTACGAGKAPEPQTPADTTLGDTPRKTNLPTCRWVPPLPEGREDPCEQIHNGSELVVTERADMRAESKSESKHTCLCE